MDFVKLKEEIISYSKEIGIDKIGFTSADPFVELKQRLYTQQKLNYQSGFEENDIEKRTNPALLLPGAGSIISIALAYPSKLKNAPRSTREERRGLFCRASWGTDYHHILRDRLNKLEEFIFEKIPDAKIKSMVDTGELSDRAVAERAGIGWSGKNCAVITPEFGSYVYLGEMITTIPFPSDQPIEDMCGTCTKCLEACPTGALVQGGQINATKCIGFLTQTKGFIEDEYRVKIGNRVYGCDTCQVVCPHNKGKDFHFHFEMDPDPEVVKPELKSLLFISNKEFKEKFGPLAGSWRGKKPIQRNAIIGLAHYKDETAINDLTKVLAEDTRPVLRGTAAWAIGKIGAPEGKAILERAKEKEQDEEVLIEIEKGLKMMARLIFYTEMESPIGPLTIIGTKENGLCNIEFGSIGDVQDKLTVWLKKHMPDHELKYSEEELLPIVQALDEYFKGNHQKNFDLPIRLYGTPFQKKVWNELLNIEYGSTRSYKDIAEAIAAPKAVRAIGTAIGQNPVPIIIPCHRVINSNGKLGGFTGGLDKKIKLLELEKSKCL